MLKCSHWHIDIILTGSGQVRFYASDLDIKRTERYEAKPPSFDEYRWKHKKDATRSIDNEKQMNYHYLVMGGELLIRTQALTDAIKPSIAVNN